MERSRMMALSNSSGRIKLLFACLRSPEPALSLTVRGKDAIAYWVNDLAPGKHELTLRVWDQPQRDRRRALRRPSGLVTVEVTVPGSGGESTPLALGVWEVNLN
jgi:hypothetical protein